MQQPCRLIIPPPPKKKQEKKNLNLYKVAAEHLEADSIEVSCSLRYHTGLISRTARCL